MSLIDDLREMVEDIADDISITTNIGDGILSKLHDWDDDPLTPDTTLLDHLIDKWVDIPYVNFTQTSWYQSLVTLNLGPIAEGIEYLVNTLVNRLEFLLERILEIFADIAIWGLDVLWSDIFIDIVVKWSVWIVAAGLRIVIAAPCYSLGKYVLENFLERLSGANVERWMTTWTQAVYPAAAASSDEAVAPDTSAVAQLFQAAITSMEGIIGKDPNDSSWEGLIEWLAPFIAMEGD